MCTSKFESEEPIFVLCYSLCRSYDLQRIVVTFVPSFDPCSRLPLSYLTSSVAPNGFSICLFQLHQQTNTAYSIFYPSRPKTAGLMSCPLFPTPFLCCVAGNGTHRACCVHVCTLLQVLRAQHHYATARPGCPCIPPSSLHLNLSSPRPSVGTVTPGQAWVDV